MPRATSRSSSTGRSSAPARSSSTRAAPAAKPAAAPAPAPVAHAPAAPPAMPQQSGGMMGGLGRTIMEGMAFGTGSAIAHRAVGAIANSFTGGSSDSAAPETAAAATAPAASSSFQAQPRGVDCNQFQKDFMQCVKDNQNDIASCQHLMDNYTQCQSDARLH